MMPTFETYDSNGKLVSTETVEAPESAQDRADREFRDAVERATSIADLKAALLGTTGPGAEARRP